MNLASVRMANTIYFNVNVWKTSMFCTEFCTMFPTHAPVIPVCMQQRLCRFSLPILHKFQSYQKYLALLFLRLPSNNADPIEHEEFVIAGLFPHASEWGPLIFSSSSSTSSHLEIFCLLCSWKLCISLSTLLFPSKANDFEADNEVHLK